MASSSYEEFKAQADELKRARGTLRRYADATLDRMGNRYVCPSCHSGEGPNHSPAFTIYDDDDNNQHWKCFGKCGKGGDVYALAGIINHIEGNEHYREQVKTVADTLGYRLDADERFEREPNRGTLSSTGNERTVAKAIPELDEKDYSLGRQAERDYIKECQARIDAPEAISYLQARGFTIDEIHSFGFGYDPHTPYAWQDSSGKYINGGRIIIPWQGNDWYHIDRAMADASDISDRKYDKPYSEDKTIKGGPKRGQIRHGVGEQPFYNPSIFKDRWSGVFIVEGVLDALAVEAMGQPAIALAGVGYDKTLRRLESEGYQGLIILMLDSDKTGREMESQAAKLAEDLKLKHYETDFSSVMEGCKDACDALAKDREAGGAALKSIWAEASEHQREKDEEAKREVMKALSLQDASQIAGDIWLCEDYEKPTPTGFHSLDSIMHGGLNSGLIVLGATSSAGKTTFVTQVADYIAEHGRPVLFVTMEQSGRELVAKSLSRLMAERGFDNVNLWDMGNPARRQGWTDSKTQALADSTSAYTGRIAPNLVIMAADARPDVNQVETAAQLIKDERHISPVIILDYLQLLSPLDPHQSDKQAVDYNVSQLRRISRPTDLGSPIIAISSLNRSSYSGSITMDAFKESGAVEYSADVLLGLQPYHYKEDIQSEKGKDKREQKAEELIEDYRHQAKRKAEIVVLKNRNGYIPTETLPFTFYAPSSRFVEGLE